MNKMRTVSLFLIVGLLTGCGFHFRSEPLVASNSHTWGLQSKTPYAPLEVNLKRRLKTKESGGDRIVEIIQSGVIQRPRAISGDKRLEEIEITYDVTFQVLGPKGEVLVPPTQLSRSESVLYDRTLVLGNQHEIEGVERELAEVLVSEIMYRLSLEPVFMNM